MPSVEHVVRVYQQLAEGYEKQGQAQMRDRFLVLAADAALGGGRPDEAERLRGRLLPQNRHPLLKTYPSLAEALKVPDVRSYVTDLRRSYPPETAQNLLQSLAAEPPEPGPQTKKPPAQPVFNPPLPPSKIEDEDDFDLPLTEPGDALKV